MCQGEDGIGELVRCRGLGDVYRGQPLVAAGHRVLAPDLIGFGRSDKPAHRPDYSYAKQVGWVRSWMEQLDFVYQWKGWGWQA